MSEPTDKFQQLEDKAVKYAIAVEARDAIQRHIRNWIGVVAIASATAGWFGFSLHREMTQLQTDLKTQTALVGELKSRTGELGQLVERREQQIQEFTRAIVEKQQLLDHRTEKLTDNTSQLSDSTQRIALMAAEFGSQSRAALQQMSDAAEVSAKHVSTIRSDLTTVEQLKKDVARSADTADAAARDLGSVMQRAREFDASIEGQRQVFRNALLDYVTLTRNATSPELLLSTADPNLHYRVVFRTPSNVRRTGFTLSYDIMQCAGPATTDSACQVVDRKQSDKVIKFVRNERAWHELEGTQGRYKFAVDYIFTAKLARNHVTIRVGATDKLLPQITPQTTSVAMN